MLLGLAVVDAMARTADGSFFDADMYNGCLHDDLRPYCGIDMTDQYSEETKLCP